MNELAISCNLESPQKQKSKIIINIYNNLKEKLVYKYMIGCNGTWSVLKDFTESENIEWIPKNEGKYILMVQAKKVNGSKSFDYVSRMDYVIGKVEEKLITAVHMDKKKLKLGDKLNITVSTSKMPLMFRYWIKIKDEWEMIKDYCAENTLSWTVKSDGKCEILVECKNVDSKNKYDDFKIEEFQVFPLKEIKIMDFKCLTGEILVDSELTFQVDAQYDVDRTILYKFFKISSNGQVQCIQNYSTKRTVSYVEHKSGEYKLLCMVKDMYSQNKFDDRAMLNFEVKKYSKIYIKNFITDINYPQLCGTKVTLKSETIGGRDVLYRYIIYGKSSEDSGYTHSNSYVWESKAPGDYKITLMVKDKSFQGSYEAMEHLNYVIDERSDEPVKIEKVLMDKNDHVLINENINVEVEASGGVDLRYSFIMREKAAELYKINYCKNKHMKFIPKKEGNYELEVRVKDKYSKREYDCHSIINITVLSYIPAAIDYVLYPLREYYLVGDKISINCIVQNTTNVLMKYVLSINNHQVEETDFVREKTYVFTPKYSGRYKVDILAKNVKGTREFDCKKEVTIKVNEALPVTNTRITCDNADFLCNKSVIFTAHSEGGKDVLYEFYIMEKGDWNLVQNYSKKNYYTFIPFEKDEYKVLVLSKSQYNKVFYEDYTIFSFKVN
ncbi:triple tyrosine motif-containing protein [Clostridium coskatii]|uniref:Y_Y_Y domain protein n=2 Tax=Clostridium TaxID=1485 RepID=A0A166TCN6_9CLOT|nr:triple tyrosine motif-containing protein [Clostridium coskatii]OAA93511.1 Y_Y_Y domain protein [Clostridium coskatii]OBR96300.1 Y_Y_Y domain protein [Clostridium coskatii]